MPPRLLLVLFALATLLGSEARALSAGAHRDTVIGELGEPSSQASRGKMEILSYPQGVRVVLINGRVDRAEGIELTVMPDSLTDSEHGTGVEESTGSGLHAEIDGTASGSDASATLSNTLPASAHAPGEDARTSPAEEEGETGPAPDERLPIAATLILLGVHLAVTLLGLKIAFKFWDMDAFFSGMLAIAVIDVVLHALMEALGPVTGGITHMRAVEHGIPGFVMIFTIRHYCFNKDLSDAIQTAAVVKIAVLLIKAFAAMGVVGAFS